MLSCSPLFLAKKSRKPQLPSASRAAVDMVHNHFLLLTYPMQGHINPCLQLGKRLVQIGVHVTFVTTVSAQRLIARNAGTLDGLKFDNGFSDGYDGQESESGVDTSHFLSQVRSNGSQRLREIIATSSEEGCPVTCLVYNLLCPWAAKVARDCHVPSALLWIQPAAVLGMYHYYFNGHKDVIAKNYINDPTWSFKLPGLPLVNGRDLPFAMFLSSTSTGYDWIMCLFEELMQMLDEPETKPKILVNTFDAIEPEALKAIDKYDLTAIGPLIPSAFLDGRDPLDTSFGGDLFQKSKDYTSWLNSKPESSVIYVSFGSLLNFPKSQMEEIAGGLLETRRPFLWVIREKENEEKEFDGLGCMEELEQQGIIVPWCSQLDVLSHPSLGCFVTHCGWNSTLESMASGVPVVAFPHWSDQGMNASMIVDAWKIGVRVRKNEEGIVERDEVKRCIEKVMGIEEGGEEMRRNSKKWKDLAREAVKEGGSSDNNLKAFLEEVGGYR